MLLVYVSIPIMVLVTAITLVPLIAAMRIEWLEQRRAARLTLLPKAPAEEERLAA